MKSINIEHEGRIFTIKELTMRDVLPIIEADDNLSGIEIAKIAVFENGAPIGDNFLELPFPLGQKLITAVGSLNNVMDNDTETGNA